MVFYFVCVKPWPEVFPAGNCMFKVNNRNTWTRCKICSKLTIKTPEQPLSGVFTVNFEHISDLRESLGKIVTTPFNFLQSITIKEFTGRPFSFINHLQSPPPLNKWLLLRDTIRRSRLMSRREFEFFIIFTLL